VTAMSDHNWLGMAWRGERLCGGGMEKRTQGTAERRAGGTPALRRGRRGFTLLEMLVAMAMVSLLATALYMSLNGAMRARARAEAAIGPARSAALALETLKQDLEAAPPAKGILAGAFVGTDGVMEGSSGDGDTLAFYSVADDPERKKAGIRKIELMLETVEGEAGVSLVRAVTENLLAPQTPDPVKETICRKVAGLNLRYYDGASWQDAWDSTTMNNALPLAVEMTLTVYTEDGAKEALSAAAQGSNATTASSAIKTRKLTRVMALPCGATAEASTGSPASSQ